MFGLPGKIFGNARRESPLTASWGAISRMSVQRRDGTAPKSGALSRLPSGRADPLTVGCPVRFSGPRRRRNPLTCNSFLGPVPIRSRVFFRSGSRSTPCPFVCESAREPMRRPVLFPPLATFGHHSASCSADAKQMAIVSDSIPQGKRGEDGHG